jgi:hypothetical protein
MDGSALLAARMVVIAAGFPLVAYLFGSSVLRRVTDLDDEERFAGSWGVSIAFLGFGQFVGFALHVPPAMCALGLLTFMLLVTFFYRPRFDGNPSTKTGQLKLAFTLVYLHLVCIQALLPNYRGGNWAFDWWMHYDQALIFAGRQSPDTVWLGSYNLASRTPLFNLTTASVMSLAGSDFAVFQLASALPNCVFVLPLYLLLRNLFDRRAGYVAVLLAALNVWLMHNAWFTWPKMLAAYYMLLGLHFYLQAVRSRERQTAVASRYYLYAVCCGALGYMTHQVALFYFLPLVLHAVVLSLRNRAFRPRPAEVAVSILAVALLLAPWYGWLVFQFGWRQVVGATPATAMNQHVSFRFKHVLHWMTVNTAQSLFPVELAAAFYPGPLTFTGAYRGSTTLYFSLLPGTLTLSLTIFLGCMLVRWCGRKMVSGGLDEPQSGKGREWAAVWCFALLGYAGAALLHPTMFGHGIAHSAAFPTVVVVTGLAWGLLSRRRRLTAAVVTAGIVTEFLLVFWSHWWLLLHRPDVLEDLPGNEALKSGTILFLSETLPGAQALLIGATVVIQVALLTLLVRACRTDGQGAVTGSAESWRPAQYRYQSGGGPPRLHCAGRVVPGSTDRSWPAVPDRSASPPGSKSA